MTVEKKLNTRLDQQIAYWLEQERLHSHSEDASVSQPVIMEVTLPSKKWGAKAS